MRWPPKNLDRLSTPALQEVRKEADRRLEAEVMRLRRNDPKFAEALNIGLAVEDALKRRGTW